MESYRIQPDTSVYFVTCSAVEWLSVFVAKPARKIVTDCLAYGHTRMGLRINAYVIMPTHLHLIRFHESYTSEPLPPALGHFRRYTERALADHCLERAPACYSVIPCDNLPAATARGDSGSIPGIPMQLLRSESGSRSWITCTTIPGAREWFAAPRTGASPPLDMMKLTWMCRSPSWNGEGADGQAGGRTKQEEEREEETSGRKPWLGQEIPPLRRQNYLRSYRRVIMSSTFFLHTLCAFLLPLAAAGDEIVIPLPIEKVSWLESPKLDDPEWFSSVNTQIGLSVINTDYEPAVDLDSSSSLDPLLTAMKNMMLAALANDRETYQQGLLQDEDIEYSLNRMRRKLLPEYSPTELPQVSAVTSLAGINIIVRSAPAGCATETLVSVDGVYKLSEIVECPPLKTFEYFLYSSHQDPERAQPFKPDSTYNQVIIDKYFEFDSGRFLSKLYFKGFIPTWGRKILRDGEFVIDSEEALHREDEHYELIRFVRDSWYLYSQMPNDRSIVESPAFKGYATRLSKDLQNVFVQGAANTDSVFDGELERYFGENHSDIRLLYVIDADPFYLAIWLPGKQNPDDEQYKNHGLPGSKPTRFKNSYGVDLYQKEGASFFIIGIDCIYGRMIQQFFKWPPVHDAMLSFIADAYEKKFDQE